MAVDIYTTTFHEAGTDWKLHIFQGKLAHLPTEIEFDNAALNFDGEWITGLSNNSLGAGISSSIKCKVDIRRLSTALKKIITTPQKDYVVGQYNPSTCWVLYRNKPVGVSDGAATAITVLSGGSGGYTSASDVHTSGGHGTGLTVDIDAPDTVNSATIHTAGTGFQVGDIVTILDGSNDATIRIDAITPAVLGDHWILEFIGTQYQALEKEYRPMASDPSIEIEIFDIKTDFLSQITFKDWQQALLDVYAFGIYSSSELRRRKQLIDNYINGSHSAMAAANVSVSIRYYEAGNGWMHFFSIDRLFDALNYLLEKINVDNYDLTYLTGMSSHVKVYNPLNHWYFTKRAWSENDNAAGDALSTSDLKIFVFATSADTMPTSTDDILDGLFIGKSSLGDRYENKGILEWMTKEWEVHLAKARGLTFDDVNSGEKTLYIDAAPIWSAGLVGNHKSADSLSPVEIELSDISADEATIKVPEEFITGAKVVVHNAGEHFDGEYSTLAKASRREANRDYEITFHNMPSRKAGTKWQVQSLTPGKMAWVNTLAALPIGVICYEGPTTDTLFPNDPVPLQNSTLMIRVNDEAYCILDTALHISSSGVHGNTKSLITTTGYTNEQGAVNGLWDIVANLAQRFTMPQHITIALVSIFGDPSRINLEFDVPYSLYRAIEWGAKVLLDIRALIGDADVFENVTSDNIYVTKLTKSLVPNSLKVNAISQGYNNG